MAKKDEDFKYEIVEHLCDLGDANEKGWKKELNIVKWNGGTVERKSMISAVGMLTTPRWARVSACLMMNLLLCVVKPMTEGFAKISSKIYPKILYFFPKP